VYVSQPTYFVVYESLVLSLTGFNNPCGNLKSWGVLHPVYLYLISTNLGQQWRTDILCLREILV
jgi:hypothetical protein